MAENGYDNENGFRALEKGIQIFWANIDIDFLQNKSLSEFQFSSTLKAEFDTLLVVEDL